MEKINKLKDIFKKYNLDGYLIQKMMNFLMNTFLIIKMILNLFLIFQDLMV